MPGLPTSERSNASSPPCGASAGWSIASDRSRDPNRSCAISPVTPIGSPSRTVASLQPMTTRPRSWKYYRVNGPDRWKTMRLQPHEFIRRFLVHVLPKGFHRIRHYGLFASTNRAESIATARALLNVAPPAADPHTTARCCTAHAACAAQAMPALWRAHDRHRDPAASRTGGLHQTAATPHEPNRLQALQLSPSHAQAPRRRRSLSTRSYPSVPASRLDALQTPADRPPTPCSPPVPADKQLKSCQPHVYHR